MSLRTRNPQSAIRNGLAACCLLVLAASAYGQRAEKAAPAAQTEAPTVVGQVVAYEPDKSIALETRNRNGVTKSEFRILKDKTKIDLPPRIKEIRVGMTLAVWADKDDAAVAARIGNPTNRAAPSKTRRPNRPPASETPGIVGQVVAYEAGKSVTIEIKQRGGQTRRSEFTIAEGQTKIAFAGDAKAIAVGMPITVWPDKDNAQRAARIVAGQPRGQRQPMPRSPAAQPDSQRLPLDAPATPVVMTPAKRLAPGLAPAEVATQIDRYVDARLAAEKVPASPASDDSEFQRRVWLDIAGVIPPADKAAAFLDSKDPHKRTRLIDELLARPQYGSHFADIWCDRINVKDWPIYREPFVGWMADSLNQGRGWDQVVFDMLTAEGQFNFVTRGRRLGSAEPQALFILLNTEEGQGKGPNPAWLAAESARLFLGAQLQCAECHNHPFTEAWKQTDFWGLAAFYSQLRAERVQQGGLLWRETPAAANQPVNLVIPVTALKNIGKTVPARLPGEAKEYQPGDQQLLRHALARWMTAPGNPFFAKATANRMWAHFFGRGLVNPVDDLRADNRPSHPETLNMLADEFTKSGFDLKYLIRCICLSRAYQRTSAPLPDNEQDHDKYSHMVVKVTGPGVFYDSLKMATGLPELKVGLPERKTKLTVLSQFTPREVFVDFFRSSQGEEASPLENTHGIPQALKLMNAAQLNSNLPATQHLVGLDRTQAIEQLYLTTLARKPTLAETKLMTDFLARRKNATPVQGYSDVLWTLINSAEFVSNR